jgi:diguanylate cyclase (GGDEF)-like protein
MQNSEINEFNFSSPELEQDAFYIQVFQHSMVPQIIVDKDLAVFAINNKMFECLQMKPFDIIGKCFGDAFSCCKKDSSAESCIKSKDGSKCPILKVTRNILLNGCSSACTETSYTWGSERNYRAKWFQIGGVKIYSSDAAYALLSFVDITMQKHQENILKKKLTLDQPTGLMNKQSLISEIKKLTNRNYAKCYTLCMIDFDDFKSINDQCGHLTGDKVLKVFADIVRKNIRKCDQVGRFGGEEFIFIFIDSDPYQSLQILQRIYGELYKYFKQDIPIPVTFSAGFVFVNTTETAPSFADLLLDVDRLLYQAKNRGKGRALSAAGEFLFSTSGYQNVSEN